MGGWYDPEKGRRVHSSEVGACYECGASGILDDDLALDGEDDHGMAVHHCRECAAALA
jgi:hypothetical protein